MEKKLEKTGVLEKEKEPIVSPKKIEEGLRTPHKVSQFMVSERSSHVQRVMNNPVLMFQ